jgi:hypothetical protein
MVAIPFLEIVQATAAIIQAIVNQPNFFGRMELSIEWSAQGIQSTRKIARAFDFLNVADALIALSGRRKPGIPCPIAISDRRKAAMVRWVM